MHVRNICGYTTLFSFAIQDHKGHVLGGEHSEIKIGRNPGWGSSAALPRGVGPLPDAKFLIFMFSEITVVTIKRAFFCQYDC